MEDVEDLRDVHDLRDLAEQQVLRGDFDEEVRDRARALGWAPWDGLPRATAAKALDLLREALTSPHGGTAAGNVEAAERLLAALVDVDDRPDTAERVAFVKARAPPAPAFVCGLCGSLKWRPMGDPIGSGSPIIAACEDCGAEQPLPTPAVPA